jgi:hypothetical protein
MKHQSRIFALVQYVSLTNKYIKRWSEPCVQWAELAMYSFWAGGISSFPFSRAREYCLLRRLTNRCQRVHFHTTGKSLKSRQFTKMDPNMT